MSADPKSKGSRSSVRTRELIEAARQDFADWQQHAPLPRSAPALPPPDSFPGYTIVGEIRRGGQGVVYRAIQESTRRDVAIKVMREGPFAGPHDKVRFEREVQILGQLNHPGIVTIHDSGTAGGCHYFVMDYIPGQPLDAYMASAARSVKETLQLFARICAAVNAAHLRGIIHRDLKPGNILVDNDGEPHILDFGLARTLPGETAHALRPEALTVTGQFIGSLPWASPEQAEGAPGKIDIRTDVYALGVILYQMLTDRFPYEVIGAMQDVLNNIVHAEPIRPSTIRTARGGVNNEIETIALKCLSKERERRYQSAGELARDVERYLTGQPIEAKRDSAWYVLRKLVVRHRFETTTVMAVAVTIISFGAISLYQYAQTRRAVAGQAMSDQAAWIAQQQVDTVVAAEHLPLIRRLYLPWFLLEWHQGRLEEARLIQARVSVNSPEHEAMSFLLDQTRSVDALLAELPPEAAPLGWFVAGERELKADHTESAMRYYESSLEAGGDGWFRSSAEARLRQLRSTRQVSQPTPDVGPVSRFR